MARKILVYGNPDSKQCELMREYLREKLSQDMISYLSQTSFSNLEDIRMMGNDKLVTIIEEVMKEKSNKGGYLFTATIKKPDAVALITIEAENQNMEIRTYEE